MKNAIILHGMPSKEIYYQQNIDSQSNSHWIPWLQQQLLRNNILTQTPEMPKPYSPDYEDWLKVFNQFTIDEESVLIGHSCGGGFLVRWLSENNVKVKKIILVAPWTDPKKSIKNGFFEFNIGKHLADKTTNGITIFNSDNDGDEMQESVKTIRNSNPDISYQEFHNYGHFCFNDMKTREFPELLVASIS